NVRETKWRLDRKRRLDSGLVRERSTLHAQARGVWLSARRENHFAALAPFLTRIVDLERRVAGGIDAHRDAYEILLEGYEPGATLAAVRALFGRLRQGLQPLIERLSARLGARRLATSALCGDFSLATQRRFNRAVAERIGFDFNRGRLDEAAH